MVIVTPLQIMLGIAHEDLRLVFQLLGHGNPFHEAPVFVLMLLPEAANEDRRLLHATRFSTRRSHSANLFGLPLCD